MSRARRSRSRGARAGGEQGLKGCGASSLEGRGGRAGPREGGRGEGRGQAPPNLLSSASQSFPEAASSENRRLCGDREGNRGAGVWGSGLRKETPLTDFQELSRKIGQELLKLTNRSAGGGAEQLDGPIKVRGLWTDVNEQGGT